MERGVKKSYRAIPRRFQCLLDRPSEFSGWPLKHNIKQINSAQGPKSTEGLAEVEGDARGISLLCLARSSNDAGGRHRCARHGFRAPQRAADFNRDSISAWCAIPEGTSSNQIHNGLHLIEIPWL